MEVMPRDHDVYLRGLHNTEDIAKADRSGAPIVALLNLWVGISWRPSLACMKVGVFRFGRQRIRDKERGRVYA